MKKVQAIASGKVQGVGFRMYTQSKAEALGVLGFVQNLDDGTLTRTRLKIRGIRAL